MKWSQIVSLSRNFKVVQGNRFSRVMMTTGIATLTLCISIMLVASFITRGFYDEISGKLFDFWGHIYISGSFYDETYATESMEYDQNLVDHILETKDKRGNSLIKSCSPVIINSSILQGQEELDGILAKGVTTSYLDYFLTKYSVERDSIDLDKKRNIAISSTLAQKLGAEVGRSVILHFVRDQDFVSRKFRVVSVYNTGMAELDDKMVLLRLEDLQEALQWNSGDIGGYEVFVNDLSQLENIDEKLYNDVLPVQLFSTSIKDKYPATFDWLKMQEINQRLLFYMLLLVCVANLITIMLMLFLERIEFIGVMKTLGASQRDLRRFFLLVGGRILLWSMILGNIIAAVFTWFQDRFHFLTLNEKDYFISYVPVSFDWSYFLQVNGLMLVFGIISLFLPLQIIRRFSIINILRYK